MLLAGSAHAGQAGPPAPAFAGPPAPVLPDVVSRDETGTTVRAVRLTSPLRLDGQLDEAVYSTIRPMTDFVQTEPQAGSRATEKTEVWVLFDDDNVYVSARNWESQPDRMVVNIMQRDFPGLANNESFSFAFDPFLDHRNGVLFIVNPIGGRTDGQIVDRQFNRDWNAVWEVKVGRFDGGWTVEYAIPFKSLRYQPGQSQTWGFNVRRVNRWKNEISYLTPVPNSFGVNGLFQASLYATMVGLDAPPGSKNLDIKPYVISSVGTDRHVTPAISNDVKGDVGVDIKYGVTQNLTADFTYNTDFAQVEADEQQVNLTRFSLFFPEKREFFLENLGLFAFGGTSTASGNTPLLFYSRRIGLNQGRVVPIDAGGRLTGRFGRYGVGVLNIVTGDERVSQSPRTDFSVVRVKRDILRKSSVGLMVTGRSVGQNGTGSNAALGVDSTLAFFQDLAINTYWAHTQTDGLRGRDTSYRAQLNYAADRYGVQAERLVVGDNFNPEVGFVRRDDMGQTSALLRFSPRPRSIRSIRRFSWTGSGSQIENGAGRLETRNWNGEFAIEFQNGDRFNAEYDNNLDAPRRAFTIGPGVVIPVGRYDNASGRVGYNLGNQRKFQGTISVESGGFYGGTNTGFSVSGTRATITPQLSLAPTYSINRVDVPQRTFTTHLAGSRVTYTATPQMFMSALLQYSSDARAVTANVRLRWEYRPGSELFVVYNEQRDSGTSRFPVLGNRAFIVKINRLFRK